MSARRYVTAGARSPHPTSRDSTPPGLEWEEVDGRRDPRQRFALYRLCECQTCEGSGKDMSDGPADAHERFRARPSCLSCRGEGRVRELVATCPTAEAVGVALVTLGREGEWAECPLGVLDRMGEPGKKWILKPWLPSPRNVRDAGRTLRASRRT